MVRSRKYRPSNCILFVQWCRRYHSASAHGMEMYVHVQMAVQLTIRVVGFANCCLSPRSSKVTVAPSLSDGNVRGAVLGKYRFNCVCSETVSAA